MDGFDRTGKPGARAIKVQSTGMEKVSWASLGSGEEIGPFSQGFSGVNTTAREHARFLFLALHHGKWGARQVVPESYMV